VQSAALRHAIRDLVLANRILAREGVIDDFGHVGVRHPENLDRYLLSRSRSPAIVSAEDIMEFTLDGEPVDQMGRAMYAERPIHGEAYRARPDVGCVAHHHRELLRTDPATNRAWDYYAARAGFQGM
jgi:ribulose-5-phosphate 4-epimerase/fuculose-1-phosphate aldolase